MPSFHELSHDVGSGYTVEREHSGQQLASYCRKTHVPVPIEVGKKQGTHTHTQGVQRGFFCNESYIKSAVLDARVCVCVLCTQDPAGGS